MLRDDAKLKPAAANDLAASAIRRLVSSMSTPAAPQLDGYRVIPRGMPDADRFMAVLAEKYIDVDHAVARGIWDMVYDRCRDLPLTVADPSAY